MYQDKFILLIMDKDEHNYYHSYQDVKDEFNEHLTQLSIEIFNELWADSASIQKALADSLAESSNYAAVISYCYNNNSASLLGEITMELISLYLTELADELAEAKLT